MVQRRIDKPIVVHFLESTKEVLAHLGRWTMELNTHGQEAPKGLSAVYGSTRRLRDYLQRSLSAFPQPVPIDLSENDEALLVGCFLYSIGQLDGTLVKDGRSAGDRGRLEQKRSVLATWCLEMSTRLPVRIPSANKFETVTPTVRDLMAAITKKVVKQGGHGDDAKAAGGAKEAPGATAPGEIPKALALEALRAESFDSLRTPSGSAQEGDAHELDDVVDARRIRDPRLRAMVTLDTRSYGRALAAADHRLALVHLYSIFEAGIIDHGLTRRAELGLPGNVEAWTLEGIVQKALGDRFTTGDSTLMAQLVSARALIRPALLLMAPLAVTQASLRDANALVRRIFVELGLVGSGNGSGSGTAGGATSRDASTSGTSPIVAGRGDGSGWSGIWAAATPQRP